MFENNWEFWGIRGKEIEIYGQEFVGINRNFLNKWGKH